MTERSESVRFRPEAVAGLGTWSLTWHGVRTVAVLELRQRVKSSRWLVILLIWGVIVGGLTALIRWSIFSSGFDGSDEKTAGATMFGVIVFMVLSLGSLVSPALSATSVNGDRTAGVLAIMQSTLLTPVELAVGKLLAAWTCALALLAVALPFIVWAYLEGGTPIGRLITTLLLLALTLLVVCAIGLGYSALTAKTSASAVLTYLTVAFFGVGLPLLFALTLAMVTSTETITIRQPVEVSSNDSGDTTSRCEVSTETSRQTHTERTWWLLAASPYVVVADAAPVPSKKQGNDDPLSAIRQGVREARLGPANGEDWCGDAISQAADQARQVSGDQLPPIWPYGLAADLLIGAAFLVLTVRRLKTPADRLSRGTRVA
jgi:ABC-type transport system involved in multi-copper enzyme maturation permease subunit